MLVASWQPKHIHFPGYIYSRTTNLSSLRQTDLLHAATVSESPLVFKLLVHWSVAQHIPHLNALHARANMRTLVFNLLAIVMAGWRFRVVFWAIFPKATKLGFGLGVGWVLRPRGMGYINTLEALLLWSWTVIYMCTVHVDETGCRMCISVWQIFSCA